jgi:hypothetical protein
MHSQMVCPAQSDQVIEMHVDPIQSVYLPISPMMELKSVWATADVACLESLLSASSYLHHLPMVAIEVLTIGHAYLL